MVQAMTAELVALKLSDFRTEVRRFFADPEAYRQEYAGRLVPVLVSRGEEGRRAGDVVGAAADFSRALAYAPRDPELPKLMLRLRRGTMRRQACLLGGMVVAGAVGIGLTGYAALHMVRERGWWTTSRGSGQPLANLPGTQAGLLAQETAAAPSANRLSASAVLPTGAQVDAGRGAARKAPESAGGTEPPLIAVANHPRRDLTTGAAAGAPGQAGAPVGSPGLAQTRDVRVLVNPKGARVSIDDGPFEDLSFGKIRKLSAGVHSFRASVPNSSCCEPLTKQLDIRPDDGTGTPQEVALSLTFHEASLSSPAAPPGATLRCPLLRVSGPANQVYRVPMSTLDLDVPSCELELSGTTRRVSSVTLRAGVFTPVPWSGP